MRAPRLFVLVLTVLAAASAEALPIVTEVCWMGSEASASDEWIELYNPGPGDEADLSAYVLFEGGNEYPLPAQALPAGGVFVIEKRAEAISDQDNTVISFTLNNGGEELRVCPVGQTANLAACDVPNPAGGAWFAGVASPRACMVRVSAEAPADQATSWVDYDGTPPPGALDSSGVTAVPGTPGVVAFPPPPPDAGLPDVVPPPDGGEPLDAGLPDVPLVVDAGPPSPTPTITEVCWMGSSSSANDEYVELYNHTTEPIALDQFVLIEGSTQHPLPPVVLAPDAFLVLERSDTATSLASPEAEVLAFSSGLRNDGEILSVCRATDLADCDHANAAGDAWPAGDNGDKLTMVRIHPDLPGEFVTSWRDFSGQPSAVTDSGGVGFLGSPGEGNFEIPQLPDAGVFDAFMFVDAGPNDAPTIALSAPAGTQSGAPVEIAYVAADPNPSDFLEVSLFYDLDGEGNDGVLIARGLPPGDKSYSWDLDGVPPGRFHVFGKVTDHRGGVAFGYAPGTVDVGDTGDVATILLIEPDGVNDDVTGLDFFTIRWEAALPPLTSGVVSLYYDVDDDGADGVAIATGLPATADDDAAYSWDLRSVDPGTYNVYAVLDWTRGQEVAVSPGVIQIPDENCGCQAVPQKNGTAPASLLLFWATVAMVLGVLFARRRSLHRRPAGRWWAAR